MPRLGKVSLTRDSCNARPLVQIPAFKAQTGAWAITGAGGILGSYLSLANGWTAGGGAYGLTSAGALNVASCTGCAVSTYCQAAGTNTITCAGIPPPVSYAAGQSVIILIAVTNTGATTLNINSLGAKAIHSAGMALAGRGMAAVQPSMQSVL